MSPPDLSCVACGARNSPLAWCCRECGGLVELDVATPLVVSGVTDRPGLWRYLNWLPVDKPLSLGEPTTPILELSWYRTNVLLKLEGALPTGSFKDRGSAVLVRWLAAHGAKAAVMDSSGNAGASIAAYCARAGLGCHVYVPESASPAKLAQVVAYGGVLHPVAGTRQDVADAARQAESRGNYASHAWHPLFLAGTQTIAYEIWEQLGESAPDALVLPVGSGTLLLGAARGFAALRGAGLIAKSPRIFGVQSTNCAPLANAWASGTAEPEEVVVHATAAEGIRVARPPRGGQVLDAVRRSGGAVLTVSDDELWQAHTALARHGVYAEPTSAVAMAGLGALRESGQLAPSDIVVVPITATGLKV